MFGRIPRWLAVIVILFLAGTGIAALVNGMTRQGWILIAFAGLNLVLLLRRLRER